ncbi:MAG: lipid-A-disaccharide synthase, partial [Candidatus Omnitrophota bacterium]|nr:lipid-A-disaccharide synthase [Candidatus Omnitrophota bacterium]
KPFQTIMAKSILIIAGEPSGDLHASNLAKDLKKLKPDLKFFGLGGKLCKEAGVEIDFDISKLSIIGLVDVWKNIFTIGKVFKDILKKVDSTNVDLAILVDYPGFNLRLARELSKRGIPVIYYISPQVWAWGADRIGIIKECVTKILVFFKFEEDLYKKSGVSSEFVGNPLLETVKITLPKDEILKKYGLSNAKPVIALLPGSRAMEVKTLLKIMAGSAGIIAKGLNGAQFVVAKYKNLPIALYEKAIKDSGHNIKIIDGDAYNILSVSDFAIVASGTATLETAIIGTPFVITYKVGLINYIAYKIVAKTKILGLVNVIARRVIVPEFLQYDATPEKIARESLEILQDGVKRAAMISELARVKSSLGTPGASMRAAGAILPYLS